MVVTMESVVGIEAAQLVELGMEKIKSVLPDPHLADYLSLGAARLELTECVAMRG